MDRKIFRRIVIAGFLNYFVISITGIIDCAVIGRFMGSAELSAYNLADPVFSFFVLLSSIIGTGLSVVVSKDLSIGAKDRADKTVKTVITLIVAISAISALIGIFIPESINKLLGGADFDQDVFKAATDYIQPLLISALPMIMYDVLCTFSVLEGADKYMQISSVVMFVTNVLSDVIIVLTGSGMLELSISNGICYTLGTLIICLFYLRGKSMFRLQLCKPDMKLLIRVLKSGIPMIVKGLCGILWPLSVNRLMMRYGSVQGLAALSIQNAIHYLPVALCQGISNATLILTGIYSGEQDREGLRKVNRYILRWSLIGVTAVAVFMILLSSPLMVLFTDDPEVQSLSASALRLYLIGTPFLSLNLCAAAYFQGIGRNAASSLVVFVNHIFLSISSAILLAWQFGTRGIFASYGVCEIVMTGLLLLLILFIGFIRRRSKEYTERKVYPEIRSGISSIEEAVIMSEKVFTFCRENGIDVKTANHIALCTEELAANSIEHGFNDGKEHNLEFRSVIIDDILYLRLRDDCRRFDLVERYNIIRPQDPTKNIGLRIIFGIADDVSYSSAFNMNNVCVKYSIKLPQD
ncbi:MAG: ATP-binding protein [Clostridia bacterium]|nr:ATP-binding protein [Clostridia bacterium]